MQYFLYITLLVDNVCSICPVVVSHISRKEFHLCNIPRLVRILPFGENPIMMRNFFGRSRFWLLSVSAWRTVRNQATVEMSHRRMITSYFFQPMESSGIYTFLADTIAIWLLSVEKANSSILSVSMVPHTVLDAVFPSHSPVLRLLLLAAGYPVRTQIYLVQCH